MSNEKRHNRPKYSFNFKQDAAKQVLEKGYSQQQAADHLGVSLSEMGRWVGAERKPTAMNSILKKPNVNLGEHDELMHLRKENEQLRMEREILKKAAIFFAKETEYPRGTSKVRVYSRATEDVSSDRAVSSDAGKYQRLLRLVKSP
ncbi:MAG: transposase [Methylomonas sp.]|jgi:transposase|uniref:transposase n=1 Tax=Methylomonas sp. TaxID=418 RepID=UPI0025FDEC89|nr:transposase [Methylomonas sp.]MCK9605333.1 transposase [Methylomonas sp.]